MQIRFLIIDDNAVFLLGRELELTPTERKILYSIACEEKCTADDLTSLLRSGAKKENISAHISAINSKARRISGRKLIIFGQYKYKINPYM